MKDKSFWRQKEIYLLDTSVEILLYWAIEVRTPKANQMVKRGPYTILRFSFFPNRKEGRRTRGSNIPRHFQEPKPRLVAHDDHQARVRVDTSFIPF